MSSGASWTSRETSSSICNRAMVVKTMNVLTATKKTQGRRDNDFCWAVEGELVTFPVIECDCGTTDDACGCHRAMAGLASSRGTTTIQVIDRPELDAEVYYRLIAEGLRRQGYIRKGPMDAEVREWLRDVVGELVVTASIFEPGTVLDRRDGMLSVRERTNRPEKANPPEG